MTPTIVWAASAVPARSSNILSSAVFHGMVCDVSAHRSSLSCSPMLTRNTSLSTRSTRTTTALHTEHRLRRPERTSTPPVCPLSDTHTSVSMLSGVLKCARQQVERTHGAMAQTLATALDGLSLIGILMLGISIAQALNDLFIVDMFVRPSSCHHLHRCDALFPPSTKQKLSPTAASRLAQSSHWWVHMAVL